MSLFYQLELTGLSCEKCLQKLTRVLTQLPQLTILALNKQQLKIEYPFDIQTVIHNVSAAGYTATLHHSRPLYLKLSQLTCQHSLTQLSTLLHEQFNLVKFELSLTQAIIYDSVSDVCSLCQAINKLGFDAKPIRQENSSPIKIPQLGIKSISSLDASLQPHPKMACAAVVTQRPQQGIDSRKLPLNKLSRDTSHSIKKLNLIRALQTPTQLDAAHIAASGTTTLLPLEPSPVHEIPPLSNHSKSPKQLTQTTTQQLKLPLLKLQVNTMSCASCIAKIEQKLSQLAGVITVRANLATHIVLVEATTPPSVLLQSLKALGYPATLIENSTDGLASPQQTAQVGHRYYRNAILALTFSLLLMIGSMLGNNDQLTPHNQVLWFCIAIISLFLMMLTGREFFIKSWRNLKHAQTTMDSLVALSAGTAWLYSSSITLFPQFFPTNARHLYFEAALMVIGFINLGRAIETKGKQRSSQALQQLLALTPSQARLVTSTQQESFIPVEQIEHAMILRVNTGERIPVDGKIVRGEGWLNEAMLTGEALPQYRQQHETVFAGTLVENGSIWIVAEAVGAQTKLAQIIAIVEQAQSSKPKLAKLVDRIAAYFVPTVLVIAIISALVWWLCGPTPKLSYALIIFTTVIIIACPCALGLATPMSVIAAVARAAQLGILVKDADALEQASTLTTVVFDKTGTLTIGKPCVSHVEYLAPSEELIHIIQLAVTLEQSTHHPLADAIIEYAKQFPELDNLTTPTLTELKTHRGLGISANYLNQSLLLGNEQLLLQHHIPLPPLSAKLSTAREQGATLVFFAINNQLVALFALQDLLRQEAVAAVAQLQQQGYELMILTGDHPISAQYIAQKLHINHVIANQLPQDKALFIKELQQNQAKKVAMIGDGINDAPSLAQANVGIAMGKGSHIAIETANLVIMTDDLFKINSALALAKQSTKNIKENLWGAFIYNIICIPIAAGLLYPLCGVLLNPMLGSLAMALSSVTVIANANRLLKFKPPAEI